MEPAINRLLGEIRDPRSLLNRRLGRARNLATNRLVGFFATGGRFANNRDVAWVARSRNAGVRTKPPPPLQSERRSDYAGNSARRRIPEFQNQSTPRGGHIGLGHSGRQRQGAYAGRFRPPVAFVISRLIGMVVLRDFGPPSPPPPTGWSAKSRPPTTPGDFAGPRGAPRGYRNSGHQVRPPG